MDKTTKDILSIFGIKKPRLLGKGGEGEVYDYGDNKVLKIYGKVDEIYLKSLKEFQNLLTKFKFSFLVPKIYEIKQINKRFVTTEKRLEGINGETLFINSDDNNRKLILANFLNGADEIGNVSLDSYDYGQVINSKERITSNSWNDYLLKKLNERLVISQDLLLKDVDGFKSKIDSLKGNINEKLKIKSKKLVHHDYYLNNVLMDDGFELSSVLDFSPHTVVGDSRMDIAGAVTFLGINKEAKKYIPYMYTLAINKYGNDISSVINLYLLYYSIYFSDTYMFDQNTYNWCIENLNNEKLWKSIDLIKAGE